MDNKQDRQFYWEVKQFLHNDEAVKQPNTKKTSIKDAISSVVNENKVFKQNNFQKETESQKVVPGYLSDLSKAEKKYDSGCKAYTSNKTVNPFNLVESKSQAKSARPDQNSQDEDMTMSPRGGSMSRGGAMTAGRPASFDGGSGGPLLSARELEQQEKMERINAQAQERMAASRSRREQLAAQRRQDKVEGLKKDIEAAGLAIPEVGEGEELDYDKMMTSIGSSGRRAVEKARREKSKIEAEQNLEDVRKRLGGKDIADMTEKEAAEWAFAHSRVNTQLKTSSAKGDYPGEDKALTTAALGRNTEQMERGFARLGAFEDVRKREAAEAALDKPISPFYKISRREFKNTFGRDYDASGGANTANMRALQNWKTDLPGRLTRGEEDWQDKMVFQAEIDFANKNKDLLQRSLRGDASASAEYLKGVERARVGAKTKNPIHDYKHTDFDVPPGPGAGSFGGPQKVSAGRTIPTQPVKRKTNFNNPSLTEEINLILQKKNLDEDIADTINRGFGSVVRGGVNLLSGLFDNKVTRTLKNEADAGLRATGLKKTEEEEKKEELADRAQRDSKIEQDSQLSSGTKNFVNNMFASVDKTLASADQTLKDTAPKPIQGVDASDEATEKAQAYTGTLNSAQVLNKVGNLVGGNMGSLLNAAGTGIVRGAFDAKDGIAPPAAQPQATTTSNNSPTVSTAQSEPVKVPGRKGQTPVQSNSGSSAQTVGETQTQSQNQTTTTNQTETSSEPTNQQPITRGEIKTGIKAIGNVLSGIGNMAGEVAGDVVAAAGKGMGSTKSKPTAPPAKEPSYKPGMSNVNDQSKQRAQAEEQRRMRNRQPNRDNRMLQQGMAMASRYGVNAMSQLGGAGSIIPSNVNLSMGSLGSMQNQNLSGFKMSRGML